MKKLDIDEITKMAEEGKLPPLDGRERQPGDYLVLVNDPISGGESWFLYSPEQIEQEPES